jgi:hypothetical protein
MTQPTDLKVNGFKMTFFKIKSIRETKRIRKIYLKIFFIFVTSSFMSYFDVMLKARLKKEEKINNNNNNHFIVQYLHVITEKKV